LRKAIGYHLPGLRDVDFDCIERGLEFLSSPKLYGQADLMAGLSIVKERDIFWLVCGKDVLPLSDFPGVKLGTQYTLNISSTLYLANGWQLQSEEVPDPALAYQESKANLDPYQVWMDAGEIVFPMIVRCRKAGERFQPLGMNHHSIKVSDVMINLKIPKRVRPSWPLICSGGDILWIPGCRPSQIARITQDSRLIVHLTLSKVSSP
jgi:tRNA(Ile)-lysidine synthetase-like protein